MHACRCLGLLTRCCVHALSCLGESAWLLPVCVCVYVCMCVPLQAAGRPDRRTKRPASHPRPRTSLTRSPSPDPTASDVSEATSPTPALKTNKGHGTRTARQSTISPAPLSKGKRQQDRATSRQCSPESESSGGVGQTGTTTGRASQPARALEHARPDMGASAVPNGDAVPPAALPAPTALLQELFKPMVFFR